jgi:hypothetical protein
MTALAMLPLEQKKVLVDPHPFWGGWVVAIIAAVIFIAFSVWIVVQRVRGEHAGSAPGTSGQGGSDD